ncbi:MAG: hypothetical protein ACP5XB_21910 [Isosphaeraceae bacterium]
MPRTATVTPGKTDFVKVYLSDHPDATAREVNEAWTDAGMPGTISHPVVSQVRRTLGMISKPRARTRKTSAAQTVSTSERRGSKPRSQLRETTASAVESGVQDTTRITTLLAVEVEIDHLIFQVMNLGGLPEVETALRAARRAVYQVLSS